MKDMHPDVRLPGTVMGMLLPGYTKKALYKYARLCKKLLPGKWLGRHTAVEERLIPRPDGSKLRVLVCRSKKGTKPRATGLLWIHGGGYAMGAPEQDFFFADPLVKDGSAVAVLPAYTLSTEKPYPAALEDCYRTLLWMRASAGELGIDPNQLFVGGDSAGGGLTAALCLYARDRAEVNIAFQMPLYPMLDDRFTPTSQNNDAPVWNTKSNVAAWQLYLQGLTDIPAYAAPARAEDLRGLPPMCTYVGTIEPFYAETVEFVNRARDCGVPVLFKEYPGCFHAFDLMGAGTRTGKDARAFLRSSFRQAQKLYFADNKEEQL